MENEKPKRKTYTSSAVKNRWNKKHYDSVSFQCKKGGKDLIKELAEAHGLSLSKYLQDLVRQDALRRSRSDIAEFFGGGG